MNGETFVTLGKQPSRCHAERVFSIRMTPRQRSKPGIGSMVMTVSVTGCALHSHVKSSIVIETVVHAHLHPEEPNLSSALR